MNGNRCLPNTQSLCLLEFDELPWCNHHMSACVKCRAQLKPSFVGQSMYPLYLQVIFLVLTFPVDGNKTVEQTTAHSDVPMKWFVIISRSTCVLCVHSGVHISCIKTMFWILRALRWSQRTASPWIAGTEFDVVSWRWRIYWSCLSPDTICPSCYDISLEARSIGDFFCFTCSLGVGLSCCGFFNMLWCYLPDVPAQNQYLHMQLKRNSQKVSTELVVRILCCLFRVESRGIGNMWFLHYHAALGVTFFPQCFRFWIVPWYNPIC